MNEFDRLVTNLESGEISTKIIAMAYAEYIRRRLDIPEGARNQLASIEFRGLLHPIFALVDPLIGAMELSYRRGMQEGKETK